MKHLTFSRRKLLFLSGILCMLALYSCSKDDDNPPAVAGFMAFNLSPDQSLIGISLSGNTLLTPLAYQTYTGGYVAIYPGKRSTESFDVASGNTIASASYTYEPNKYYSLFVIGAKRTFQNIIVNDNIDLPGNQGKAYIRYINAIPDSSKPLITVTDNEETKVKDNAGFSTVSGFTQVNAGSVKITINDGDKINAKRTVNFEEEKIYTILFSGNPSSGKLKDSVQIKYIVNGTAKQDTASAKITELN